MSFGIRSERGDFEADVRPTAVGRQEAVGAHFEGGRDDERIGESKCPVGRPQLRGTPRDGFGDRLDARCQRIEESIDRLGRLWALPERHDEDLCVGGRRQYELVPALSRLSKRGPRRVVVRVIAIEESDHDARIQDCQRHSSRIRSR